MPELAEALALAHDIGHPPFGHAGEKALDHALQAHGLGFDHNLHALRIVTWFEERYAASPRPQPDARRERRHHQALARLHRARPIPNWPNIFLDLRPPLEAQLIDLADEIAYLTADFDDGLDSGILNLDDVRDSVPSSAVSMKTCAANTRLLQSRSRSMKR